MLSQAFRNPNVELAAAGLLTVGCAFFYGFLGLGIVAGFFSGPSATPPVAGFLAVLLTTIGVGVLRRSSWAWTLGIVIYPLAIGIQLWAFAYGDILLFTIIFALPLMGSFLYLMLSKDDFETATRPQDVRRPNYPGDDSR